MRYSKHLKQTSTQRSGVSWPNAECRTPNAPLTTGSRPSPEERRGWAAVRSAGSQYSSELNLAPILPKLKSLRRFGGFRTRSQLLRFLYFPTLQAACADADTPVRSLNYGANRAQIHVPAPLGDVMGVADIVSKLRPFAADFAYACHLANSRFSRP